MLKLILILSLCASFSASAQSTVQAVSKAGQHPMNCTGTFGQSGLLKNTGYKDEELRIGIPCEVADFDENGSNDYWFSKCDKNQKCKTSVVLMNKHEVMKSIDVKPEVPMSVHSKGINLIITCKGLGRDALVTSLPPHIIYTLKKDASGFEKYGDCK